MAVTPHTEEAVGGPMAEGAWYPDPLGRFHARWYDGTDWTRAVHDGERALVEPAISDGPDHTDAEPAAPAAAAGPPDTAPGAETADADPTGDEPVRAGPATDPRGDGPGWRTVAALVGVAVIVVAALSFGWNQRATAAKWRDRSDELVTALTNSLSANDTFEESLGVAASDRAQLTDSQEAFAQFEEDVRAVTDQIYRCADTLGGLASSQTDDVDALVERAEAACGEAVAGSEGLKLFLDELQL